MSVYYLSPTPVFPSPEDADPDGLLAVGGDLSPERLLAAYENGIFPWYNEYSPILWWSPTPRLILEPKDLHISKSLRRLINKNPFEITLDRDFSGVIHACAYTRRPDGLGTWLVPEMIRAYIKLHRLGFAHSIEAWQDDKLVGGMYGLSLGRAFFGESMFYRVSGASKLAIVYLVRALHTWGFDFLDCQQTTRHMLQFGAREVCREVFLRLLEKSLAYPTCQGAWTENRSPERLV